MSLRHRIAAATGAITLGAVGLLTLPGLVGTAVADTCSGSPTSSAAAARAFGAVGRPADQTVALSFLRSQASASGGWSEGPTAGSEVAATAAAVAALRDAGVFDPAIVPAQEWLTSLQTDSGAIGGVGDDRRTTADALPGLTGTRAAAAAAAWLQQQLVDGGGDGEQDHFRTDGVYDHRLTADAVIGWDAADVQLPEPDLAAAWLGRHATEWLEQEPGAAALARLILVAEASGQSANRFGPARLDLVAELTELQDDDGRFADDVATHALALRALADRDVDDTVLSAAADALAEQECTGGGFPAVFLEPTAPTPPSPSAPSSPAPSSAPSTVPSPTASPTARPTGAPSPSATTTAPSTTVSLIPPTSRSAETVNGLQLDLDTIAAGQPVTFSVGGFAPNERVRIELHSTPVVLGYLQVDSRGAGSATVTVPRTTVPGLHQIWVIGESSGIQFSRAVTITPEAPTPQVVVLPTSHRPSPDARLSATGATVSPASAGLVGGAILLAGVGLTVWNRRRTTARH